jgi:chromatin remodeling complex protein RSC6
MSSVVFVKCATPEQEDAVKAFCMQHGIEFEEEEKREIEREWVDKYMTPSKQLASFLGPPYLNRNGEAKPQQAFDCIVRYIHTKKLCGPNVKWGIILNETLQDLFKTTETAMEYSHLRKAVESLFQA